MFMSPLSNSQIDAYNAKGGQVGENSDPQAAQDRFLKLFVAQLNNQDPLNPLDNAQMTSQMAQINTVTGIQQVNETLKNLSAQMGAASSLQGVSLIGREALVDGSSLRVDGGVARGSFTLPAQADAIRVDVLGAAGQLLGSVDLGPRGSGVQSFEWSLNGVDPALVDTFQVTATANGQPVAASLLSRERIQAVGQVDGELRLRTDSGSSLRYEDVLAFM